MICIDVSIKNLSKKLNTSILKRGDINVQTFSIGDKLNTTVDCVSKMNIMCSMVCDTQTK